MSSKSESAELILKLYDLRREKKMRKARNWIFSFNPATADDYMKAVTDPKTGPYLRMVTSYWEMAAALVNHECIDVDVFCDTNGEYYTVFAKIEPILAELREKYQSPTAFSQMERLINNRAGGPERLRKTQEWLKNFLDGRQAEQEEESESDEKAASA